MPITKCAPPQTSLHAVRAVEDLGGGGWTITVEGPSPETLPGQFYMLRTEKRWPVLLPRPFSLYDRGADGEWGSFLMKAVGPGTRALVETRPGERIWLTGPLGNWFSDAIADPVCVAGGVGLAPFLLLARRAIAMDRHPVRVLFGGRNEPGLAGASHFSGLARLHLATEDGSVGHHGRVTGLLSVLLQSGQVRAGETVYCCGPDPMMHATAKFCRDNDLRCFLSLETYMGCGYGVCNGCSVAVTGDRFKGWPYSKTCVQGPVYDALELVELRH